MKRIIIPALLLMLMASCGSKKNIYEPPAAEVGHVREMKTGFPGNGLYYALPRTVISVDIEVTRTEKIPGPYATFAERYLGLHDVIERQTLDYEISGVKINSYSEPDPDHVFFVTIPDHQTQNLYIALNEAGMISSVNSPDYKVFPGKSTFESKDMGLLTGDAAFNYFIDTNLMERIDTIIENVLEDTITVQRQTLRRSWVEKSQELRAREVADYILEIREKKFDLISGFQEITYSKEALEFMYSELNKLEDDYLNLFTGITAQKTMRYRFIHTPGIQDGENDRKLLFRFSPEGGISVANDNTGNPVWLHYDRSNTTHLPGQKIMENTLENNLVRKGFHYRIPEYADLTLKVGETTRARARTLVNQFGIVTYLPAMDMEIRFFPETGSIKSIGIQAKEEEEE